MEKTTVYICLVLSALACAIWPFVLFLGGMAFFDAPIQGYADKAIRYIGFAVFLSYPWGFIVGLIRFLILRKGTDWQPWHTCAYLSAPYFHLIAFYWIVYLVL